MISQRSVISDGAIFADRYEIRGLLGKGGMGEVYLASDQILDQEVALKLLHDRLADDRVQRERFLREARLTRKISHPNVIRTFDVGEYAGRYFFAMEVLQGSSLKDLIGSEVLPTEEVVRILTSLSEALEAIHAGGVVHRDLKPANVMILADGTVKLTDFGVARTESSELTTDHELVGSAPYMAPELWRGETIGPPADLYALGVLAYEMLTGITPFDGETAAELMCKHLEMVPAGPMDLVDGVPVWLNQTVMRLLEKDPKKRFAKASHLMRALKEQTEARAAYTPSGPSATYDPLLEGAITPEPRTASAVLAPLVELSETAMSSMIVEEPKVDGHAIKTVLSGVAIVVAAVLMGVLGIAARAALTPATGGVSPGFIVSTSLTLLAATLPLFVLVSLRAGLLRGIGNVARAGAVAALCAVMLSVMFSIDLGITPSEEVVKSAPFVRVAHGGLLRAMEGLLLVPPGSLVQVLNQDGGRVVVMDTLGGFIGTIQAYIAWFMIGWFVVSGVARAGQEQPLSYRLTALIAFGPSLTYEVFIRTRLAHILRLDKIAELPVGPNCGITVLAIVLSLIAWNTLIFSSRRK